MKKRKYSLLSMIITLLLTAGCTSVTQTGNAYSDYAVKFAAKTNQSILVAQDGDTRLYLNESNGDVKLSGKSVEWKSYPFFDTTDKTNTKGIYTPFLLKGYDIGGKEFELDAYFDCILKNQFEVVKTAKGFEMNLTFGKIEKERLLPMVIRAEVFDSILAQVKSERGRKRLPFLYKRYSLKDTAADETVKKDWLVQYPSLETYDLYALKPDVTEREKDELETYIKETDFTLEKLAEENALLDYKGKTGNKPIVTLTARFTLENGDLKVSIPVESIRYDTTAFILNQIDFLPSLSTSFEADGSYLFVPDGCGAWIDLKSTTRKISGKTTFPVYGTKIHRETAYDEQLARLPVFGLGKDGSAMLAIIEQGDSVASIHADYGNSLMKTVYPSFVYKDYYSENASDVNATGTKWSKIEKSLPTGNFTVRYHVLSDGKNDYNSLAGAYRDYLEQKGELGQKTLKQPSLYIETLGSINNGLKNVTLTSFTQDKTILDDYAKAGVESIVMKLKAWSNGGYENSLYNKIRFMTETGSQKEFNTLVDFAVTKGISLFPGVDFMTVSRTGIFDGFYTSRDAARGNNGKYATITLRNSANGQDVEGSLAYLVKPVLIKANIEKFNANTEGIYKGGLSLENMGSLLYADFSKNSTINRTVSQSIVEESLSVISKTRPVMIDGGNAYSLKYASHVLNAPQNNSNLQDYAGKVPFFQMVYHGYKNYTGQAVNLASDPQDAFLQSLETGNSLYFVLAYQNSNQIKSTAYSNLYSVDYTFWKDQSIAMFQQQSEIMKDLDSLEITNHRKIQDKVYATTYGDQKTILVNYNSSAVEYKNTKIEPKSYLVLLGKGE